YGGSLSAAQKQAIGAAIATGNYSKAVNILQSAINKLPANKKVQVQADVNQALGAINSVQGRLNGLQNKTVTVTVVTHQVTIGGGSYKGHGGPVAMGGIIRGQEGFVTQAPTYMVGEGGYSTFAGRGAEAVIPLNTRGIDILAKAMKKAGGGMGG